MDELPRRVIRSQEYRGYRLNSSPKCLDRGFYSHYLDKQIALAEYARENIYNARAAHFVVDEPDLDKLDQIRTIVRRWDQDERNSGEKYKKYQENSLYFYVLEDRYTRRSGGIHLHLYVLGQFNATNLEQLRRKLKTLGGKVTLKTRDKHYREHINLLTGEIELTGHSKYHDLSREFEDFMQRFSYLAKRKTKLTEKQRQIAQSKPKRKNIGSSQLPKPAKSLPPPNSQ